MIALPGNKGKFMNRTAYLKTAVAICNERNRTKGKLQAEQKFSKTADLAASIKENLAKLMPVESEQLLFDLTRMLERERRKCKARAGLYDAGRHIHLYLAVKNLKANKNPR